MGKQILGAGNAEGLPFSEAVRAGDFIFLSGLVGFGADGGHRGGRSRGGNGRYLRRSTAAAPTRCCDLDDVVKVNVYLADA